MLDRAFPFIIGSPAMFRNVLKSKIHRARVTDADVHYEGSITIDRDLMEAADLLEFEEVHVWDVTNAARLSTYVVEGERGSGTIAMNGAAAHLIKKGDIVIIASFSSCDEKELSERRVLKVFVDSENRIMRREKGRYRGSADEGGRAPCKAVG
jgi:aspartate 1-decarboxylase